MRFQLTSANLVKRIATGMAIWVAGTLSANAQTSLYSSMTLAGDFQGWNPGGNNMVLVSNNVWETTIFMTAARTNEFKFTANGNRNVNWGAGAGQSAFSLVPIVHTGVLSSANNIRLGNVRDGLYRFRFDAATRIMWIDRTSSLPEATNLLRNAGFEDEGSSEYDALYWEYNNPDSHGDNWGNSFRAGWRKHSGSWMGAIGAFPIKFGGWWQEVTFGPDYELDFSGYFYTDPGWTAAVKEVKVEFFNNSYAFLGSSVTPLTDLTNNYTIRQFSVSPPASSTWARLVINASDTSDQGTLEFDTLTLNARANPNQSFTTWDFASYIGQHNRGGWAISNGFVSTFNGRSQYTANLQNSGEITSGLLTNGVGLVTFWYRNGWRDEDSQPTEPVSFELQLSPNGVDFTDAGITSSLTNILNDYYLPFTFQFTNTNQKFLRIRHNGGSTNTLLIDDIAIGVPSPVLLFQNFDSWPTNLNTADGWIVLTGTVSSAGAYSGQSAMLHPSAPLFGNYVQSPQYPNGIGRVAFQYARGTNGSGPAAFAVQSSTNGTTWKTLDVVEQILATGYQDYERTFTEFSPSFLRIVNLYKTNSVGGGGTIFITEGFSAGATPPTDWTFNSIGTYESSGNFGEAVPSLRFDLTGDSITTATILGNPTGVSFWAKGQSINAANFMRIEGTTNNGVSWILITNVMPFSNSGTIYDEISISGAATNSTRLKFTYNKTSGNLSFDDLRITGFSGGGGSPPPQGLFIDNIGATDPFEYRNQNFEAWPTKTSYGDYEFQGWRAGKRAIIDSQNNYDGQVVRLDNSSGLQPFIQSPLLSEGIGSISFYYRNWDGNPAVNAQIQISANATNWSVVENLNVSSTTYSLYEKSINVTTSFAVRIILTSGGKRVLIDNITISKPQPPAQLSINASISPSAPFTNDTVHILANYAPSFGAMNIGMTSYYRVGTSGAFTAIGMAITNFVQYGTTNPIPSQPTNTIVQYYIKATFSGPGSDLNSPVYYPPGGSNNPASYGIPRSRPGSVWINEVKYNDSLDFFNVVGFVELGGIAGVNMTGWKIDFIRLSSNIIVQGVYNITNNVLIQDDFDGYGFWVIGNENTPNRNQTLTNTLYQTPLGIRVLNEMGYVEAAVSFEGTIAGYERVSENDLDDFPGDTGLSLTGTGLTYAAFTWTESVPNSPGAPNDGQVFGEPVADVMDPPDLYRVVISNGNVYVWSAENTNGWSVAPYFTTNLNVNPQNWQPVTPFNNSPNFGGTNVIWFTIPSNGNSYIYRIRYQSAP